MEPTFHIEVPALPAQSIPNWALIPALVGLALGLVALVVGVANGRARIAVPGVVMLLLAGGLVLGYPTSSTTPVDVADAIQGRAWPNDLATGHVRTNLAEHYDDIRAGVPVRIERLGGERACVLHSTGADDDDAVKLTLSCRPGVLTAPAHSH